MKIGFEDAIRGVQTKIRLNRLVSCPACQGAGTSRDGGGGRACPDCNGTGRAFLQRGFMKFSSACPSCGGSGRTRGQNCGDCRGEGLAERTEQINVRIPPGVTRAPKSASPKKARPAQTAARRAISTSRSRLRPIFFIGAKGRISSSRSRSRSPSDPGGEDRGPNDGRTFDDPDPARDEIGPAFPAARQRRPGRGRRAAGMNSSRWRSSRPRSPTSASGTS